MKRSIVSTMLILALFLVACGPQATPTTEAPATPTPPSAMAPTAPSESPLPAPTTEAAERTLTVMTHSSFDASEEALNAFQESCNCQIKFLEAGDTGLLLSQALLSKDNPLADVIYGVDNTFLSRALQGDILEPYESPALADIPDDLELDPSHRMLPVDYGDVCLNYDKAWFDEQELAPPTDLPDLTEPDSGDHTYLDYWAELRANDVLVTDGWEDAYYGNFTYASDGDRPIVVSYASSPPVEVYFSEEPFDEAPTGVVTADESCFRQIEFVGILKGTQNRDLAEQWIDFMLGVTFQEDIPLHMFVFPANSRAELPDVFAEFAQIPENPVTVDPGAIEENREQWIEAWLRTTLR